MKTVLKRWEKRWEHCHKVPALWRGIVLFESGLDFVLTVCATLWPPKKKVKKEYNWYATEERNWSHIKCSIKTTKCRKKSGEDKNRNKKQGQWIENSNKYGKCC